MSELLANPKFRDIMLAAGWRNKGSIIGVPQATTLLMLTELLRDFERGEIVHVVVFDWFDEVRSPTRIVNVIPVQVT